MEYKMSRFERREEQFATPDENNNVSEDTSSILRKEDQVSVPDENNEETELFDEFDVEAANILNSLQQRNQQLAEKAKGKRLYSNIQDASRYLAQESLGVSLVHPKEIQVTHFNIHPTPTITFSKPLPRDTPIRVDLEVASKKGCIINEGFLQGDVQIVRAGHNYVTFPGLQLNRMDPIKKPLGISKCKPLQSKFQLRFTIESSTVHSNAFSLTSNVCRIPKDLKGKVRPFAKSKSTPTSALVSTRDVSFEHQIFLPTTMTTSTTSTSTTTIDARMSTSLTCTVITTQEGDGDGDGEVKEEKVFEGDVLWRILNHALDTGDTETAGAAAEQLALMPAAKRQKIRV